MRKRTEHLIVGSILLILLILLLLAYTWSTDESPISMGNQSSNWTDADRSTSSGTIFTDWFPGGIGLPDEPRRDSTPSRDRGDGWSERSTSYGDFYGGDSEDDGETGSYGDFFGSDSDGVGSGESDYGGFFDSDSDSGSDWGDSGGDWSGSDSGWRDSGGDWGDSGSDWGDGGDFGDGGDW